MADSIRAALVKAMDEQKTTLASYHGARAMLHTYDQATRQQLPASAYIGEKL